MDLEEAGGSQVMDAVGILVLCDGKRRGEAAWM